MLLAVIFLAMIQAGKDSLIWVHVTTRAHESRVDGWLEGKLRVRLRAVAEKGKANSALIELLANYYSIAKSQVEIVSGTQSRIKRIRLRNVSVPEVY